MEEYSMEDPAPLLLAASDFAHYPGLQNEASVRDFLGRFPLPVIINTLQTKADVPEVETVLVACLERIFETKYGASLIPQYMAFLQVGLKANSQDVRLLACKTVSYLLKNVDDKVVSPSRLLIAHEVYPLLLDCLVTGDERVAAASMNAIKDFAASPEGIDTIFPASSTEAVDLRNLAARSSSLGRVRVLALVVKLFSVSHSVASVIYSSGLLGQLEVEVQNTDDMLVKLNVLELICELAEMEHGAEFLSKTTMLQLVSSIIRTSTESILRSRAIVISGRMLSKDNIYTSIDESSVQPVISAIEGRLTLSELVDEDEHECALEALGRIGSSNKGAELLFSTSPTAIKHVVEAAFDKQRHGMQLAGYVGYDELVEKLSMNGALELEKAALYALGNIAGENRSEGSKMLNDGAEQGLRRLIYDVASKSSKLAPSGLFLSILQQDSEIRVAAYTLISNLVVRPWCFTEICSKQEIINILTDPKHEGTKIAMDARYNCCLAVNKVVVGSVRAKSDSPLAAIAVQMQEAVNRGPYLAHKRPETQPEVATDQRF